MIGTGASSFIFRFSLAERTTGSKEPATPRRSIAQPPQRVVSERSRPDGCGYRPELNPEHAICSGANSKREGPHSTKQTYCHQGPPTGTTDEADHSSGRERSGSTRCPSQLRDPGSPLRSGRDDRREECFARTGAATLRPG